MSGMIAVMIFQAIVTTCTGFLFGNMFAEGDWRGWPWLALAWLFFVGVHVYALLGVSS